MTTLALTVFWLVANIRCHQHTRMVVSTASLSSSVKITYEAILKDLIT